jgi:hypothetical protein
MRKRTKGSFSSSEQAREAAKRRWEAKPESQVSSEETPAETLRRLSLDPNVPAYAQVQAAKALSQLPDVEAEQEWRDSPQIRADYLPPTWDEVLAVARQAGAVE